MDELRQRLGVLMEDWRHKRKVTAQDAHERLVFAASALQPLPCWYRSLDLPDCRGTSNSFRIAINRGNLWLLFASRVEWKSAEAAPADAGHQSIPVIVYVGFPPYDFARP